MKKKPLSHYLDLIKSANDKQDWAKANYHGESALKQLPKLSYSPFEEYYLYLIIGHGYFSLAKYSQALDFFYKAYLLALKYRLEPFRLMFAQFKMGHTLVLLKNLSQALSHLLKVEEYYQKYDDGSSKWDKQLYFSTHICLGYYYLYKNQLEKVAEIIDKKLTPLMSFLPNEITLTDYHHLKGRYLMSVKKYEQAYQSFSESLKFAKQVNYSHGVIDTKIHLATIELLRGQFEPTVLFLENLLKETQQLKLNDLYCEIGLLLAKCYTLENMPAKSVATETKIKASMAKLDVIWLYEKIGEIEQFYQQLQTVYPAKQSDGNSIPAALKDTLNHYYETLTYKYVIVGQSVQLQEVYQLIEKIAPSNLPVLIQGETGTGKELIARAIHRNSLRIEKPWLALNCGAIPESLLESELFGHTKGAFTDAKEDKKGYIELASDGTLFLDEIAEMSPTMQQKLLRVMDEKLIWRVGGQKPIPVNNRFIFASNQNIEELVKGKHFREDLFYRINTILINLSPLRDRKEDIPLLINHFLVKYSSNKTQDARHLTPDALGLLINYSWPGNVRELENEIRRILTLYQHSNPITESMISESIRNYLPPVHPKLDNKQTFKDLKEDFERNVITETIKKCNGNITKSAHLLGFDRSDFYKKMNQLKIKIIEKN